MWEKLPGVPQPPHTPRPGSPVNRRAKPPRLTTRDADLNAPVLKGEAQGLVPRTPAGASVAPALPPRARPPGAPHAHCRSINSAVMYFMNIQMAETRARGKVLPWDKKLTLANSKFTACIFIFLIPAPSASNWGSTSVLPPFISPAHSGVFFFFSFYAAGPSRRPPADPAAVSRLRSADCEPRPGQGHRRSGFCSLFSGGGTPPPPPHRFLL